jgi:hypothetical protein
LKENVPKPLELLLSCRKEIVGVATGLLLDRGAARFIISGFYGREIFVDLNRTLARWRSFTFLRRT